MSKETRPSATDDLWNYQRYYQLDDGIRYQVFSGTLVREPAPTTWHQSVIQILHLHLAPHVRSTGGRVFIAPVDVVLDAGGPEIEILQPDLLWIRPERVASLVEERRVAGPPDLAVEVLSPSNRRRDRQEKVGRYQRFGVSFIWLIDPKQRRVEEWAKAEEGYRRTVWEGDEVFQPMAFPGWSLPVRELWEALH